MTRLTRSHPKRLAAVLPAAVGLVILAFGAGSVSVLPPGQAAAAAEWADSFGVPKPGLAPELFLPAAVSAEDNDLFLRFSPDGSEAWWNSYGPDPSVLKTRRMVRRGGAWSAPSEVAMEKGAYEYAHAFSPDGRRRYFGCNRALPGEAGPVWRRTWSRDRRDDGWSEPSLLSVDGRTLDGSGPAFAADGTLYFIAGEEGTPDRGGDVFVCRRGADGEYLSPVRLGPEINGPAVEEHVFVAPDQSLLLFSSRRASPRGEGKNDLYVSFRTPDGGWSPAADLGPDVNTDESDAAASLSPDGRRLFFASNRSGRWKLYWVDARVLDPFRPITARGPHFGQAPPGSTAERYAPGVVSTDRDEHGAPVFTKDGASFYLSRIVGPPWSFQTLLFRMAADGSWTREVVRFDHDALHSAFLPSRDGARLYCESLRPLPGRGGEKVWHFWVTDLDGRGGASRPLPPPFRSDRHECQLFEAADGSFYFTSWRNGQPDLMRAVGRGGEWTLDPAFGPGVNSPQDDKGAFVSDDGGLLMFWSNRPGGRGLDDIYLCRKGADGAWSAPVDAGPAVNSAGREWSPRLSPDGRFLFFLSDRTGDFDVYWIDAAVLNPKEIPS